PRIVRTLSGMPSARGPSPAAAAGCSIRILRRRVSGDIHDPSSRSIWASHRTFQRWYSHSIFALQARLIVSARFSLISFFLAAGDSTAAVFVAAAGRLSFLFGLHG
ncbi:hypothetical protein EV182_005803, partial [Spiromyces aspiralis]